jgi:hypothetical protein
MADKILWASVYVPLTDRSKLISALEKLYEAEGYTPYDPFPGGTGTPTGITSSIRLFVGAAEHGWTRILGHIESHILKRLAENLEVTLLSVWISENESRVETVGSQTLIEFLKDGKTSDDLNRAEKIIPINPGDTMQGELGDLAKQYGVKSKHVEKLFQKTARGIFEKLDKQTEGEASRTQSEAMNVLKGQFSWDSAPAHRVQATMACLNVPQNWHEPSFKDLAAAYPIARLLDLNEDALLLPGDEDLLDKVSFPLDYTPIYYAKL